MEKRSGAGQVGTVVLPGGARWGEMCWRNIDHLRIGMPESEAGVTSERNNSSMSSDCVFSQKDTLANSSKSPGDNTKPGEDSPATAASPTRPNVDHSENLPEGRSPPTQTTQEPAQYSTRVRHLPSRLYGNLERLTFLSGRRCSVLQLCCMLYPCAHVQCCVFKCMLV